MLKIFLTLMTLITMTLQEENHELYLKPIMYGTAIGIFILGYASLAFMYGMDSERDPLVYSKFLSVRKNK